MLSNLAMVRLVWLASFPWMSRNFGKTIGNFQDKAHSWQTLEHMWKQLATPEEQKFRDTLHSRKEASALATLRTFQQTETQAKRVTLYRDAAAWCPYCEKVWLFLEEKKIPYQVTKVNMNCYGDKPAWFWAMQPSGGIPVAKIDGRVVKESNDILMELERKFVDSRPMIPEGDDVSSLLQLERQLLSCCFRWLTTSMSDGAQRYNFESLMSQVDAELAERGGPFFLGAETSIVDCMFAPFLERMAASVPYYKGLIVRNNAEWPHVERWFDAMEQLDSFRHIRSDYYTHVNDLPPQIGRCISTAEAAPFAKEIDGDGEAWRLPLNPSGSVIEPITHLGQDEEAARREAAERIISNRDAIVRFAARGAGKPGFPPVSAPLSDPNAAINDDVIPTVDAALRHAVGALLEGIEETNNTMSVGLDSRTVTICLGYLRDRISVPRDMGYPAARQCRAYLNWAIETVGSRKVDTINE